MDWAKVVLGFTSIVNWFLARKDKVEAQTAGQNEIKVVSQQATLDNIAIAQHIDHDVPIDGPLAEWVRNRNAQAGGSK